MKAKTQWKIIGFVAAIFIGVGMFSKNNVSRDVFKNNSPSEHEASNKKDAVITTSGNNKRIFVKSDPKAKYYLVGEVAENNVGRLEIVTQRVGSSGESYSKREVDCSEQKFG